MKLLLHQLMLLVIGQGQRPGIRGGRATNNGPGPSHSQRPSSRPSQMAGKTNIDDGLIYACATKGQNILWHHEIITSTTTKLLYLGFET